MRKTVPMICIVLFVICMLIVPGMASLSNNSIEEKNVSTTITHVVIPTTVKPEAALPAQPEINTYSMQRTLDSYTIQDNSKTGRLLQNAIIDKKNLTENQKKLSTALLMQTSASNGLRSTSNKMPAGKPVYVYISVKPGYSTHIIDSFVAEVPNRDEDNHLAVAWVDIQNLETLASVEGVGTIQEVTPPVVKIGSVTTEGDVIHKTTNVRSTYGYRGAGMKIGIISNGVSNIAASKASGDLPADVTVLSNTIGGDEGTAMLEIVHDIVPDAKLYFHDTGSNTIAFNAAINELYANGCTIICDDMGWYNEPYFEDGIVASNVATLISGNNVIYISAGGNDAKIHYQGDFIDNGYGFHNKFFYADMPTGSVVQVFLQWNDQFGHSANDYDLVLFDANSYEVLSYSQNVQTGTQNPQEFLYYQNTESSRVVEIDISKYSAVGKTLELFIFPSNGASLYSNNLVSADSIFGHPAVPGVIAVAAIPASSPSTIDPFSSRGPVTISYPSAVSRQKPDISGVDCVAVTGVGGFGSPFCGTSASAPHIAAIVAQIWGAHPSLTPLQIRNQMYTKATDLGVVGWDTSFGYGLADALAMASIGGNNPIVSSITPAYGLNTGSVSITNLAGNYFGSGATVYLNQSGVSSPVHKGSLKNGTGGALLDGPTHVQVVGNYAYVASYGSNALEVVDITNPTVPVHKSSITNGAGGALLNGPHGVCVSGNYAYVVSAISNALEIVDISNPATPVHKGSITNGVGGAQLLNPTSVVVSDNSAYVVSSSNALEIVDVSNPAAPVHKSSISISDYPYDVYVSGNYAYVANNLGNALEIIDISNPAVPVKKGSISNGTSGALLSSPWAVYVYGNYAYVVGNSNALEIVDVSNPAAPLHVGSLKNGAGGALLDSPAGVYVYGNQAYVTSQNSNALEIVDVSNPAAPTHRVSITNGTGGALLSNPWGIHVSGNYAYIASANSNALEIVDLGFVSATGVTVVSPTKIICSLNLTGIPAGQYNVVVINSDGKEGVLFNGFNVISAPVTIQTNKVGVFLNGGWWLDANGSGTWDTGDEYHMFGSPGVQAVTGDWNYDGKDETGVFLNGGWWLDTNGSGIWDTGDEYHTF